MSLIYITEHDESIYDAIKREKKKPKKPPMHISAFTKNFAEHHKIALQNLPKHASMGIAHYAPPNPKNYLRKFAGKGNPSKLPSPKPRPPTAKSKKIPKKKLEPIKPTAAKKVKRPCKCDQPPEPKSQDKENLEDKLEIIDSNKKNYIQMNIKNASKKPYIPGRIEYVITRKGEKQPLIESGMVPIHMKHNNTHPFGKTPHYLIQRMRDREKRHRQLRDLGDIEALPKCRYVTRQERDELLNGLKQNWEQMQKEYQLLPIITDTIPLINKKVKMEQDLLQIEKDISLIEKHPYIYLEDEDDEEVVREEPEEEIKKS